VKNAIARGCTTGPVFWQHTSTVIGARASKRLLGNRHAAVVLHSGEAFSYKITFGGTSLVVAHARRAPLGVARTVTGRGEPNLELDVAVPKSFAGRSARVTLSAWANPRRTKTFVIRL
jgi:hypothetical protein